MGAGVLGSKVAQSLQTWRFPLRCWSRTRKSWPGVQSFAGREELSAFLSQCRVLINLLPNTPETVGIINQQLLEKLPDGAYLLNLARGVHVVEDDLLAALDSGKVKGAMLDVFNREPLPPESPLWQHPRVTITPHVAAITRPAEAVDYISRTIAQLEKGRGSAGKSTAHAATNKASGFLLSLAGIEYRRELCIPSTFICIPLPARMHIAHW